eukprot:5926565-Prymnesium_polylepis.1
MTTPLEELHSLVRQREAARRAADWPAADALREVLRSLGVALDDRRGTWRRGRSGGHYEEELPLASGTPLRPPAQKPAARDRRGAPKKRSRSAVPAPSQWQAQGDTPSLEVRIAFADAPMTQPVQLSLLVREGRGAAAERQHSVEGLAVTVQTLPCARLYPELTARLAPILTAWRARFPDHVWQRFTKIPQGAAFGVARVLKEWNESCPVIEEVLQHIGQLRRESRGEKVTIID